MIQPNKFTKINLSIIGISAEIISSLSFDNYQPYQQLLAKLINKHGIDIKENYILAIIFLRAIGKIEYDKDFDTVAIANK